MEKRTIAIKKYPEPENVNELRRFLGLVGYFDRFIKDFANLSLPLYNLLKKDVDW